MSRPLSTVAVLYASGVVLGHWVEFPLGLLFGVALAFSLAALCFATLRQLFLWPLIPLVGCVNLSSRTVVLSPHDLRLLIGEASQLATIRGTLCDTPSHRLYERNDQPAWRTMTRIDVTEALLNHEWQPAFGRVAVTTPGVLGPAYFAGQGVEITGALRLPQIRLAEGLFDYRSYLRHLGIYYQMAVETTNDWRVVSTPECRPVRPWADRFLVWAQANLAKGLVGEDEPLRLLWAMTLGWKTALTDEVSEPFMRSGTLHIFAISGLHIALIAGILVSVLRTVRLPRAVCGLIALPLLWFYTAATGWQASAIRSTIMMNVIIGGWALRRPSDLINSLLAAGLIILVWEPRQLFQAGFQLSFFVVLSIGLLLPAMDRLRERLLQADPLLPSELRPRWRRFIDGPLHYLATSTATSLAAWLGSLPLIAHYFNLITPVSLLANLLVVPLSGLALMSSLGSMLCGDWLPWFTELFNHSGWFWMRTMVWISEWAADLPGAWFNIRALSPPEFVTYYLVLGVTWSGWVFAAQRRKWAAVAAAGLLAAWTFHSFSARQTVRLTIPPLGGSGLYFDCAGSANDLIVDCGSRSAAEFFLCPFLRTQGVNRPPQLLLTHGDVNHVGGWEYFNQHFPASRVATSSARFRSPAYRRAIAELEETPTRWKKLRRGDQICGWTILHPDAGDKFSQADDNAIVLRGEIYGVRILLLSDLGRLGQMELLRREQDLRADIVVTGRPAQGEPLAPALIEAIRPSRIIVASAEAPASERVDRKLRERLAKTGIPIVYSSDAGAVTVILKPGGWQLRAAHEPY